MLGERDAVILEVRPYDVHGVEHVELALVLPDRSVLQARLGAESVPSGLEAGERVVAQVAMNIVVAVRRPEAATS